MNVFKYTLPRPDLETGRFKLELPAGAEILSFESQGLDLVVWALVDPGHYLRSYREFILANTGDEIDAGYNKLSFIGTATVEPIVWHLFELIDEPF